MCMMKDDDLAILDAYDQGRIDSTETFDEILKRGIQETKTREELITLMNEKCSFIITRIANERAKDLMQELELI